MSPILESKAVKNAVELEGMRKAYLRDGRATVRFVLLPLLTSLFDSN